MDIKNFYLPGSENRKIFFPRLSLQFLENYLKSHEGAVHDIPFVIQKSAFGQVQRALNQLKKEDSKGR